MGKPIVPVGVAEPLTGEKAHEFMNWLELIKGLLPPRMTLHEAHEIFSRRSKELEPK